MTEGFKLFERLEDGTIDDVAAKGYWHLEQMTETIYTLVVEVEGERHIFNIESDSEIKVTRSRDLDQKGDEDSN